MSSQKLEVASWNLADGLSDPRRAADIVDRILQLDADVVVLPEAINEHVFEERTAGDVSEALYKSKNIFEDAGYDDYLTRYEDTDGRKDRHVFMMLVRHGIGAAAVRNVNLESRQAMALDFTTLPLSITGVHLDDRYEDRRYWQARQLVEGQPLHATHVIVGDFNAMHRGGLGKNSPLATSLNLVRPFTHLLPATDPGEDAPNLRNVRRLGSLSQRLTGMASGRTMQMLEGYGYIDADPLRQPTFGPVQLDHILSNFETAEGGEYLNLTGYQVLETAKDTESDHRIIRASIEY